MLKALLIPSLLFFFGTLDSNAQLLKRISQRVENAALETVLDKSEEKTQEETSKAFDSIFDGKRSGNSGNTVSDLEPASQYSFRHKVEMTMTSGKDSIPIQYHLPEEGNFMCTVVTPQTEGLSNYSIIDMDKKAMFIFMSQSGQKMRISSDLDIEVDEDETEQEDYTITKTGKTKSVAGYNCDEYLVEGNDLKINAWVTKDTDVRFPSDFYSMDSKNSTSNQDWNQDLDGFAMEMTMVDLSKKKNNTTTIICTSIEDSKLTINSSDYNDLSY